MCASVSVCESVSVIFSMVCLCVVGVVSVVM